MSLYCYFYFLYKRIFVLYCSDFQSVRLSVFTSDYQYIFLSVSFSFFVNSFAPMARLSMFYIGVIAYMYIILLSFLSISLRFFSLSLFKLSYDGGRGLMCPSFFVYLFLLKISPPDQTLRPACKFLILGIFYHAKKAKKG